MNIGITLVFFFISRMLQNSQCPWIVESLEDFLYYCCPECNDQNQSRDNFIQHALSKHPNAKNYLVPFIVKNEFDDKCDIDTKENLKIGSDKDDPLFDPARQPLDDSLKDNNDDTIHEDQKNDTTNFKCHHCGQIFPSKISLHNHKYTGV